MLERLEERLHPTSYSSHLANMNSSARTAELRSGRITGKPEVIRNRRLDCIGWFSPSETGSCPEVGFGEISIDLLQARFWTARKRRRAQGLLPHCRPRTDPSLCSQGQYRCLAGGLGQ